MAAPSAEVAKLRASLARRTQSYPPDHPKVVEARQALAAVGLEEHVRDILAKAPPLTEAQKEKISALLRVGVAG